MSEAVHVSAANPAEVAAQFGIRLRGVHLPDGVVLWWSSSSDELLYEPHWSGAVERARIWRGIACILNERFGWRLGEAELGRLVQCLQLPGRARKTRCAERGPKTALH